MIVFTGRGQYHEERQEGCGDRLYSFENDKIAVMAFSDGVSTCKYGRKGAEVVSRSAMCFMLDVYSAYGMMPDGWARSMIRRAVRDLVSEAGSQIDDYSCTLLCAFIDKVEKKIRFCNVGDGMILGITDEQCRIISRPQDTAFGCPVITTAGIDRTAGEGLYDFRNEHSFMICTDGAWKPMYHRSIMKPEYKESLITSDYLDVIRLIRLEKTFDDCGIAIVNTGRAA